MISRIDGLLKAIPAICEQLYQNDLINANQGIANVFPEINQIYLDMINMRADYEAAGIDLPVEILISQIKNILEAYESKDVIMLADCLKYEIYEGLLFFRGIADAKK